LYWVTVVPDGALTVSGDGRRAALELSSVAVIDQPHWPAHDAPFTPARLSCRIEWEATDERVAWDDRAKLFRVIGWRAVTRLRASVVVPSTGFRWTSDPLESSRAAFGVIGDEVNGRYYAAG
jgi:hypothetical protein